MGGKEDRGGAGRLGLMLKPSRSGVKRTPPTFPGPRKVPRPAGTHSTPSPQGSKTPSSLSDSSPSRRRKRGTQTCQLRSGGAEGTPQNVLLRNLEARRMGEGPGAGISDPTPGPGRPPRSSPLPPATWPRGRGAGHSDHWEPEGPQTGCWEIKVRPGGCQVGGPSPTPQSPAVGLRLVVCSPTSTLPWSRRGSRSRWMVLRTSNTLDSEGRGPAPG